MKEGVLKKPPGYLTISASFLAMSEYIYSAIPNRRICAAYARFGSQSHLDRHEALSCIRLFAPKRASPAPLRLYGSVLSVKLSDIALVFRSALLRFLALGSVLEFASLSGF